MTSFVQGLCDSVRAQSAFLPHPVRQRWARPTIVVIVLCALGAFGSAQAVSPVNPPSDTEAQGICASENPDPWASGSTAINPGAWANFNRSGTGWHFVYSENRASMKAILFTFSRAGKPTWLATDMVAFQPDGSWKAQFFKHKALSATTEEITSAGYVGIRFFANDATRLAVRWNWDAFVAPGQETIPTQDECLNDFNRGGPKDYGGNAPNGPSNVLTAPSAAVRGPNTVFSGYWNTVGASNTNAAPGVVVAIHQNATGDSPGQFVETHTIATFDAEREPVWLATQRNIGSPPYFELPPWTELDFDVALIIPNNTKYPEGIPIRDCPMWQSPAPPVQDACWAAVLVGQYYRDYQDAPALTGVRGHVRFEFAANPPTSPGGNFAWNGTPQPLAGTYFWPNCATAGCQAIKKVSLSDGIIVNRLAYMIGNGSNHFDEFWVSWNKTDTVNYPHATGWRHDLNTGTYTMLGSMENGQNGYVRDPLPIGSRVQYELWSGDPSSPGTTLLSRTPEARVYSVEQKGDSRDGNSATPPIPAAFVEPAPSAANSDKVGSVAGQFKVDEMGHATYQVPLVVSAGKGGLTPKLALSYNSGAADGYLGTGMSLSGVSSISACRSGVEYGDEQVFDPTPNQFCLDGQRLLLVSGTHRQIGAQYKTEIDGLSLVVITGSDTITLGGASVPALRFTVFGKDGSKRTFGGVEGAIPTRTSTASTVLGIIAWQQTSLSDVMGNVITYQYPPYDFNGERILTGISYVGGQIQFDYEATTRTDIAYSNIGPTQRSSLMKSIRVLGPSGAELRYYTWEYGASALDANLPEGLRRKRITSISECSGSTPSRVCYPATILRWQDQSLQVQESEGSFPNGSLFSLKSGDFNGDGRGDVIWTNEAGGNSPQQFHVSFSYPNESGLQFSTPQVLGDGIPDAYNPGAMWELLDMNGDGRDDIIYAARNEGDPNDPLDGVLTWFHKLAKVECNPGCFEGSVAFVSMPDNYVPPPQIPDPPPEEKSGEIPSDPPTVPAGVQKDPGSSLIADANGDGLADLWVRASDGQMWIVLRSSPTSFEAPMKAEFFDVNGVSPCNNFIEDLNRNAEGQSQALDADGDGRADYRAVIRGTSFACSASIPATVPSVPLDDPSPFHQEIFLARGIHSSAQGNIFRFQRFDRFNDLTVIASGHADASASFRTLDINADGLVDAFYKNEQDRWQYQINGAWTSGNVTWSADGKENLVRLIDFDGDSKLDFWYPNGRKYDIYLWKGDSFAGSPIRSGFKVVEAGSSELPADFDGDGLVDALTLTVHSNSVHWDAVRSNARYSARGVIWEIEDGLGAMTDILYAPLTFASTYQRDLNGSLLASGRLSRVFDVEAPSYVVNYVLSSAPTRSDPNHQSKVRYMYAGMKIQAGGRGSLGFRRISTYDVQTKIEIDSWYNQAFPFSGTPNRTLTRKLNIDPRDACLNNPDAADCMTAPACSLGPTLACDPPMAESSILKESVDEWRAIGASAIVNPENHSAVSAPKSSEVPLPVVTPGPYILVKENSTTRNFDPASGNVYPNATHWESAYIPAASHDAYGNPGQSTAIQSGGGTTLTSESVFAYDNLVNTNPNNILWQLGRLRTSKVKTTRSPSFGGAISLRQSSFTYDAYGMLESERVEGMTGTFPNALSVDTTTKGVASYYGYDPAGNRTSVRTCSTTVSANSCRSMTAATSQFHTPAGNTTVMRYSKTEYDNLRFPDKTIEVFSNGADAAREVTISDVTERNEGGDPKEIIGLNGARSKIRYGALGRKYFVWASTGASSTSTWALCSSGNCPANMGLAYVMTTTSPAAPASKTIYDLLGRPTISLQQGFASGQWIATITHYDSRGNVEYQSNPFFAVNSGSGAATATGSIEWTSTSFDALNRPSSITAPGSGTTHIDYQGLKKITTLPANADGFAQTLTESRNGAGEIISTTDAYTLETQFEFDAAGNQTRMIQGANVTTMSYDSLGRKTSMTDPDMGTWTYAVNDAGETIRQVSPRGTCTASRYDGRGRVWQRSDYANGSCTGSPEAQATWAFDTAVNGIGALASETSSVNAVTRIARTPSYDSMGRIASVSSVLDGKTYLEQSTYDQYGRAFQTFFTAPGTATTGELIEYNSNGYQYRVRSAFSPYPFTSGMVYSEVQAMNAWGKVTQETRMAGAHVLTERSYNVSTGRLERIQTAGGYLQDLHYEYDNLGNVSARADQTNLANLREEFHYDALQRLTGSSIFDNAVAQPGGIVNQYWGDGNVRNKAGLGEYAYGSLAPGCSGISGSVTPGPHAVSQASGTNYCYNANGSLIRTFNGTTSDKSLTWTAYDAVTMITSAQLNTKVGFDYGPNRERIRRLDYGSASAASALTVTHFVGSAEIRYTANGTSPGGFEEVRRTVGGVIIVQRGSGGTQTTRREYLLTDAQGSTFAVLDDYGMPINASARMSFDAFGQRRVAIGENAWEAPMPWSITLGDELKDTTRKGYTGHEQVDAVGIIHMGGRIYDPKLGRFLQADPFIQAPGNSQSLNRYSYVFNNPMTWTDPSGYWGAREQAGLRTVVAIVIACYTGVYAGNAAAVGATGKAAAISFAGGFAAGAVQSRNLRGALVGGISSLAFFGIGQKFSVKGMSITTSEGMAAYAKLALVSGVTGGVMAELQGGRFGNGFVSAGASAVLSPIPEAAAEGAVGQTVIAAVIGGTVSELSGGKFANGAITAAFQFAVGRGLANARASNHQSTHQGGNQSEASLLPSLLAPIMPVSFSSDAGVYGTQTNVATWINDAEAYYSSVGCPVDIVEVAPGTRGALNIRVHGIAHRSNVQWRTFLRTKVLGMNLSISDTSSVVAHELGHAFGLRDRYIDLPSGQSVPMTGFRGNLMGDLGPSLNSQQIGIVRMNTAQGWKPVLRGLEPE